MGESATGATGAVGGLAGKAGLLGGFIYPDWCSCSCVVCLLLQ
ncbi:hypothetical protein PO908_03030 [Streptococcus anginosus]